MPSRIRTKILLFNQLLGDGPEARGNHAVDNFDAFLQRLVQLVPKQSLPHVGIDARPAGEQLHAVAGEDVLGDVYRVRGGNGHHVVEVVAVDAVNRVRVLYSHLPRSCARTPWRARRGRLLPSYWVGQ